MNPEDKAEAEEQIASLTKRLDALREEQVELEHALAANARMQRELVKERAALIILLGR